VDFFRKDTIPNGNLDDLSDVENNIKDSNNKDEEIDKNNECDKDVESDVKSNLAKLKKIKRNKKSVQFADGVKPGEGTSPSGGEGDMPSPPPPKGIGFREGLGDLRRDKMYNSRKNRKQEKRTRPPMAKKKVKVSNYCLSSFSSRKRGSDSKNIFQLHHVKCFFFYIFIGKDNQVEETTHYSIDSHDDG